MATPPAFQNADKCSSCKTSFGMFTRKHHCRNCGKTVCTKCSPKEIPLPHFGYTDPVRVCNECAVSVPKMPASSTPVPAGNSLASAGGPYRPAPASPEPAASAAAASATSSATVASSLSPVAPPVVKKVSNCTCGSPLCVCEPDPEPVVVKEEKKPAPAPAPVKKPTPAPAPAPSNFSGFSGFGAPPSSQQWSLTGNLNENCRDAVKAKSTEGVRQLLAAKANANYADRQGMTLLHLAAMFNERGIVKLLVEAGANINAQNPGKETPLDVAPPALAAYMRELAAERS